MKAPELLSGSILPQKRIVAYYGNPRSTKMGVLGEYPKDEMLRRLKVEVAKNAVPYELDKRKTRRCHPAGT